MKKIVTLVATISLVAPFITVAAVPVRAKDITLTLNEQEQTAFAQVLDQATRNGGLAVTQGTIYFYNKLQQAISAANTPPAVDPAKEPAKDAEPAK